MARHCRVVGWESNDWAEKSSWVLSAIAQGECWSSNQYCRSVRCRWRKGRAPYRVLGQGLFYGVCRHVRAWRNEKRVRRLSAKEAQGRDWWNSVCYLTIYNLWNRLPIMFHDEKTTTRFQLFSAYCVINSSTENLEIWIPDFSIELSITQGHFSEVDIFIWFRQLWLCGLYKCSTVLDSHWL